MRNAAAGQQPCNRDPGDEQPGEIDWLMVSIAHQIEIKRLHKIICRSIPSPEDSDAVAEILALNAE